MSELSLLFQLDAVNRSVAAGDAAAAAAIAASARRIPAQISLLIDFNQAINTNKSHVLDRR